MAQPSGGKKQKAKRTYSPETRQKLSELAKKRHAEGKLGGAEFGRKGGIAKAENHKKRERTSQTVAEAAQKPQNQEDIVRVFEDAVQDNQPMSVRLKGAEAWLSIEREERKLAMAEEDLDAKQLGREELIKILADKLTSGPAAEMLRAQLLNGGRVEEPEVVDAEVVPDGDSSDS